MSNNINFYGRLNGETAKLPDALLAGVEHEDGAIVTIMSCNYDCATSVSIE